MKELTKPLTASKSNGRREKKVEVLNQQGAMARVLKSPVGQFVRVRWLPPEFFCYGDPRDPRDPRRQTQSSPGWWGSLIFGLFQGRTTLSDFVIKGGGMFKVHDTQCLFVHSHDLLKHPVPECQP